MTNIRYVGSCDAVNWDAVSDLFRSVEWGNRSPALLKSAFSKSSFVRFAYAGDQLVGMGRTVDDGAYYGMVVDLVIHPDYQHKGIGSQILCALEADLAPFIMSVLTAAPGKGSFYEKHGWLKQSNAYLYPRSERQKRDYT